METTDPVLESLRSSDPELVRVLDEMLAANETITARAAARKHPSVRHASSITRHAVRSEVLRRYRARQEEFRAWANRLPKLSRARVAAGMAEKDRRIADLEGQVDVLRASHVAMIRVVGELGGMSKWLRLFEGSRPAIEELKRTGALPDGIVEKPIPLKSRQNGDPK
jgi:hypothetical protein